MEEWQSLIILYEDQVHFTVPLRYKRTLMFYSYFSGWLHAPIGVPSGAVKLMIKVPSPMS